VKQSPWPWKWRDAEHEHVTEMNMRFTENNMVADGGTNGPFDPVMQPFVDFWSDYAKQADNVTRVFLDGVDDSIDFKAWQRRWLDSVSRSMDAFMRSPAFLQAMKHTMDGINQTKMRIDDVATEVARTANIPMASDISGLFERLHSVEEVILHKLENIEGRLQTIEGKVGIEEGPPEGQQA
jgi:hypothetical protein